MSVRLTRIDPEHLYANRFGACRRCQAGLAASGSGREYRFYRFVTRRLKLLDETDLGDGVFVSAAVVRATRPRRRPR